jgi:phage/plasmid-associated DNA primase
MTPNISNKKKDNTNIEILEDEDEYNVLLSIVIQNIKTKSGNRNTWIKICNWCINHLNLNGLLKHIDSVFELETITMWNSLLPNNKGCSVYLLESIAKEECITDYKDWCKQYKFKNSKILSDEVLSRGSSALADCIKDILFTNLKLCNEKWIMFNKDTNLWGEVKEPAKYIMNVVYKCIDATTANISKKISDEDDDDVLTILRKKSENFNKLYSKFDSSGYYSMLIKNLKGCLVDNEFAEKLDRNPYLMAFKNGIMNLRTKIFRCRLRYSDYITKTINFNYEPADATKTDFLKNVVLKKICNWNDEHLNYYLSVMGYALIGHAELEKAMWYMVGAKGNNGKTMFLDVLTTVLGCYVMKGNSQLLEDGNTKLHKHIAMLKGYRLVYLDEFRKGKKMDEKVMKELADGKTYQNEVLFGTQEKINIDCKIITISNHKQVFESDGGVENRFREIQHNSTFTNTIIEDDYDKLNFKMDTTLPEKLKNNYKNEIVNLMIDYAYNYCVNGMCNMPNEFVEATNETLNMNNKFKTEFEENCEMDTSSKTGKAFIKELEKIFGLSKKELIYELRDKMGFKYNKDGRMNGKKGGLFTGFKLKPKLLIDTDTDIEADY